MRDRARLSAIALLTKLLLANVHALRVLGGFEQLWLRQSTWRRSYALTSYERHHKRPRNPAQRTMISAYII